MSEFDENLRPFPWYRRGKVRTPLASGIVTPSIQGSLQASDIKSGNEEPLCDELALLGSSGRVEEEFGDLGEDGEELGGKRARLLSTLPAFE